MITGTDVANQAKALLLMGTIPYTLGGEDPSGMDCQGLVEWTLRQLGMEADYRGTNDMWRTLLSEKGTIEEGVARHSVIPLGALIFIHDNDGGEPERYQGDGEGNAWHVYIKISEEMLIHASASNLMVTTRTFADKTVANGGPNTYGLIRGVAYDTAPAEAAGPAAAAPPAAPAPARAWTPRYARLTFKTGCMGNGVRELQTGLNLLGAALKVDGRFGPLTEAAVLTFQREQGLEADGIVGPATWAALVRQANAPARKGKTDGNGVG